MFYLAEYINMISVSGVLTTLFLGGWRAPWPLSLIGADAAHPLGLLNTGWWPILWFVIKLNLVVFVFIWIRATLPRLRYDQFMALCWKVLIPVSLVWTLAVAAIRVVTTQEALERSTLLTWIAIGLVIVLALTFLWDLLAGRRTSRAQPEPAPGEGGGEFDPMAGGYPVPPLPGQVLPAYATASARRSVTTVGAPQSHGPTDEETPGA
jgi:NADH-quinone oxidoreductase subunit H